MEQVQLTPPEEKRERGAKARLYVRWMPHLGAEAVALYELLRVLPDVGQDCVEVEELAELLRSTPESVADSLRMLVEHGFAVERAGGVVTPGDRSGEGGAGGRLAGRLLPLYGKPAGASYTGVLERLL